MNHLTNSKKNLRVLLADLRGFCAGVDRAIKIVELALAKFGPPVYVRHEIVHNRYVVDTLKAQGAVFVEELDEIPSEERPVIFSAHGVAKSVAIAAKLRNMMIIDATCPLVSKVHHGVFAHFKNDRHVLLIGHAGHPEVIGTMGQLPTGAITLIESTKDALDVNIPLDKEVAYACQTTLAVDEASEIIEILRTRFPHILAPNKEDICYATTNRQQAVKIIAPQVDVFFVVGSSRSSNSKRLQEVASRCGCERSVLVQDPNEIDWELLRNARSLGITAGASTPEELLQLVISAIKEKYEVILEMIKTVTEDVVFNIPRVLRDSPGPS